MQDPFRFSNHQFQKPTPKPPRKQVGLLQPKALSQLDNTTKSTLPKVVKRPKKSSRDAHYGKAAYDKAPRSTPAPRPVVDMMTVTEGDGRSLYKALKRKYTTLEEESFKLVEELEKTDNEVKKLEEEKFSLLDELLVLEGLAYNPYRLVSHN
eukprot:c29670_g1_i1 orf=79-534(+)